MTRRSLLLAAAALALPGWVRAQGQAAAPLGLVLPPQTPPALPLHTADGAQRQLTELLQGKVTAVQLMFTGCTTSCPLQGALFAAVVEAGLPPKCQLLSISIDALGDEPASLARWLGRFGTRSPAWSAAVPRVADVDRFAGWLKGTPGRSGTHTAQVFLFDRETRLRYRTSDLPAAREVRSLMHQLATA